MNTERFASLALAGAFVTMPFLLGANGKGCQSPFTVNDAGDAEPEPVDAASDVSTTPVDATPPPFDSGRCASSAGGPCGGFAQAPCTCAAGLVCQPNGIPDVPGTCAPPADAGQDAGCVDNVLCVLGDHWDPVHCKCVPDSDAGGSAEGGTVVDAGGPKPDAACVDNDLCIVGDHWNPVQCKCVPDATEAGGCTTAAECRGALPQICLASCDSGPGACAHFVCKGGLCETVICE
jgi:hypothetical protein